MVKNRKKGVSDTIRRGGKTLANHGVNGSTNQFNGLQALDFCERFGFVTGGASRSQRDRWQHRRSHCTGEQLKKNKHLHKRLGEDGT